MDRLPRHCGDPTRQRAEGQVISTGGRGVVRVFMARTVRPGARTRRTTLWQNGSSRLVVMGRARVAET